MFHTLHFLFLSSAFVCLMCIMMHGMRVCVYSIVFVFQREQTRDKNIKMNNSVCISDGQCILTNRES